MAGGGARGGVARVIFRVAVLLNLILAVLLLDRISRTRNEVPTLKGELASKQDVAMMRPIRVHDVLKRHCQSCHTDRRFAATRDMSQPEIFATIRRMQTHPGSRIPEEQVDRIEAALVLMRCTTCHSEAVLSRLQLMPPEDRVRFLRRKASMPDSGFRPDQIGQVAQAIEVLSDGRVR